MYEADWGESWFETMPAACTIDKLFTIKNLTIEFYKWLNLQYPELGIFNKLITTYFNLNSTHDIYNVFIEQLMVVRGIGENQAWEDTCQIWMEYFIDLGEEETIKEFIKAIERHERAEGLLNSGTKR